MAVVLAVLCGLAAAYCLARCVVPRWRATDHGVGVDAWHVAMGAAMVLMLLGTGTGTGTGPGIVPSDLQATLFAAGAVWCAWTLLVRHTGGAHLRLGVALAAMTVMLVPTAAAAVPAGHEQHQHSHGGGLSPFLGTALLVAAVGVAVAAALAVRSAPDGRARLALACEGAMAGAMGWMAAAAF